MNSFENIKNFYEYLSSNKSLQKKLSNKIKKVSNNDTAVNIITNIASKENYIFSAGELKEFIDNKSKILSATNIEDSRLSNVAGGKNEDIEDYNNIK